MRSKHLAVAMPAQRRTAALRGDLVFAGIYVLPPSKPLRVRGRGGRGQGVDRRDEPGHDVAARVDMTGSRSNRLEPM
jgi:hypothetical protein